MKQFFILLGLALFCISCENENDATPIVISINNGSVSQTVKAGEKIPYEIEAYSVQANLNHFTVSSFSVEEGEKILIDSALNAPKINYDLIYQAPEFSGDSVSVTLKITATDTKNNTQQFKCTVTVIQGLIFLPEMTGIVLYSGSSGRPNALSLSNPSNVFLKQLADSADIDIYDYENTDYYSTQLSREWRTNTDVTFAKVNNLNYSLLTASSLKSIYASLIQQKYVDAITANDIIVLGKDNQAAGVIQIIQVTDDEGSQNDCYLFNIKLIH